MSGKVQVLVSFFILFFYFYSMICLDSKIHRSADSLFLLTITRSGLLAGISWSVCISKSQRILCISFSKTDFCLYIYYLALWVNFNFLHNSQWITFPIQSCLVLYFFCTCLLHHHYYYYHYLLFSFTFSFLQTFPGSLPKT